MKSENRSIFKNTLALYLRQLVSLFVGLYTSRVILDSLGVVDFGIYNVVAGLVGMMSFFNGMMMAATSRFFTFGVGKNDLHYLDNVVGTTFLIYVIFIAAVCILGESVGIWFLENKLVIPLDRMNAARIVYQCALGIFLCSLLSIPFVSMITAHESMKVYAYVGLLDVFLKLGAAIGVSFVDWDRLAVYGLLMLVLSVLIAFVYFLFCKKTYTECRLHFYFEKKLFKEVVEYSGWSLFGACVGIARGTITNILLNMFFGPVINAARAISNQVSNGVSAFSNSFFNAVRPQIIKNYAKKDFERMNFLMVQSAKGAFFLLFLFALPLLLETRYILCLWLKTPPSEAIVFSQLVLIEVLIETVSMPIITAANATGKIRLYQSVVGGILLLCAPLSYLFLKLGMPYYFVMISSIITIVLASIARLLLTTRIMKFNPIKYLRNVIPSILSVAGISFLISCIMRNFLPYGFVRLVAVTITSSVCIVCFGLFWGVSKEVRHRIIEILKNKLGLGA